jgi:hypothetical protein
MLMSPFKVVDTTHLFKHRSTTFLDTLYYVLIGTIVLLYNFCNVLLESIFLTSTKSEIKKIDYIRCKPFKLSEIKEISKKNDITINDFLYSLLVRTDFFYNNLNRYIVTASPINISGSRHFNNMAPIINKVKNTIDNKELFKNVHNTFNSYKYSLYIPIFSFILNNIAPIFPLSVNGYLYDSLINRSDYIYSNMIGPDHDILEDIHYLTVAKDKEIVFNIISSKDNINIIFSFKEGVIKDKSRFEESMYKAYESLTTAFYR